MPSLSVAIGRENAQDLRDCSLVPDVAAERLSTVKQLLLKVDPPGEKKKHPGLWTTAGHIAECTQVSLEEMPVELLRKVTPPVEREVAHLNSDIRELIDSIDEQSDVMLTVHGLVDSLYLKELAKKTHRGLEGLALQGLHTGGNCYGYRNVRFGERVRLQIDENEADIVVRIFKMAAGGMSLKKIAKTLNREGVTPPRGSKRKVRPSWVYTAIREMLRRELYIGSLVWNKRKYIKRPGSNKRISIPRPEHEWTTVDAPELRIIPQELWNEVQGVYASDQAHH